MLYLLHQAVDRAAAHDPERAAVCCRGDVLTYAELARRSNALAHALAERGVAPGDRVGIHANKGILSAVALYGIMKAGAAYVPLDPTAPSARNGKIVESCGMSALVIDEAALPKLGAIPLPELLVGPAGGIDTGARCVSWEAVGKFTADSPPDVGTMEQDLAYILFTSGSTGTPKGIMHTHRSALAWAELAAKTYGIRPDDRLSNHAPLHFDLSTLDYFAAAVAGATTVIIPEQYTKLPASLSNLMEDEGLTVFYSVPFALIQLLLHGAIDKRNLESLRWVLFGGEPFPVKHLVALMRQLPRARFCNVYGPTEVNGCTHYPIPAIPDGSEETLPIGKPYENVEAIVVDDRDALVPDGVAGELLIRAPTMMRGYWRDDARTESALCRRPRVGGFRDRFHRTGDVVERLPDGNLRFLGRRDRQVKVRGHRIELDEVEAALSAHGSVVEAAAVLASNDDVPQAIHASITTAAGAAPTEAELTEHARGLLPWYAVPERIEVLTEFPRTSTGKIDRRRLGQLMQER